MDVSAVVLAGGKNLRLGKNKALETFDGKSLIERVIERIRPLASQILIVTSQQQSDLTIAGTETVLDLYPDKGPLVGIYTGLTYSRPSHSLVVACDMPFLNTELLRYMIGLLGNFDAVVPRLEEGKIEPLHAVYSKSCLPVIEERLERNHLGIHSFFKTVNVRYVERDECQRLDPELLSFFNVNYQSDLDRAAMLASVGRC
ncbi:molybdenum cofactor guanylyltransferase [Chloroflexota bacterium]